MKHFNINVYGLVQGVGFRYNAKKQAQLLGLTGFVRNEYDGSVYIEAEGNEHALEEFIIWCKKGPAYANVEDINIIEGNIKGFSSFETRH